MFKYGAWFWEMGDDSENQNKVKTSNKYTPENTCIRLSVSCVCL